MSTKVINDLDALYPDFRMAVMVTLEECKLAGLSVMVYETERTWARQELLWRAGRDSLGNVINPKKIVTWAKPGYSLHHYGLAADIVFKDKRGNPSWNDKLPWGVIGVISKRNGIEWGGFWPKTKIDRPHHQKIYRPVNVSEVLWYKTLRAEYWKNKNKEAVWELLEKKRRYV